MPCSGAVFAPECADFGSAASNIADRVGAIVPVDQDLLRGLLSGRIVGAFDKLSVLEPRTGTNERDQVWRVHGAPA